MRHRSRTAGDPGVTPGDDTARNEATINGDAAGDDAAGDDAAGDDAAGDEAAGGRLGWRRVRTAGAWATTVLACLLVWFALVSPEELSRLSVAAFIRIPIEGLVLAALLLALPPRPRRIVAAVAGALLGLLAIVKILDMIFFVALNRPFNPVIDQSYLGSAVSLLTDAVGRHEAILFLVVASILTVAVLVFTPLSVLRLSRLMARHRRTSARTVGVFAVAWVLCAVFGARIVSGAPIASTSASGAVDEQVGQVRAGIADQQSFIKASAVDPYRNVPGSDLLTALRGKDVVFAFVESYGQVAVQNSSFSPQVDAVLSGGASRLAAAGFASRSAWLTSPTFGGISWLAHSTLQSGLWIDNQRRYNDLVTTDRFTLSDAFKRAGWRTVGDVPSNTEDWPEGTSFYHYDQIYDDRNVGYEGPKFSYENMPDQYIWSAFQRLELAEPDHAPVMAEIDLVSSHTPWAPLPRFVPWDQVGDGSVFDGMPEQGPSPTVVWRDPKHVQASYGQSIQYTLNTLVSFTQTYGDKNLVLVVLGDHQPATIVSGQGASHEVPITIIAKDPTVMNRIAGWGWQSGMQPAPNSPDWPMDAFRDRFLSAFGPSPTSKPVAQTTK